MDKELSVRAGLNIGIESSLLPFVQAAAGNVFELKPNGDTVLVEHTDQAARVPFAFIGTQASGTPCGGGFLWNPDLDNVEVSFFFQDELGNRILLGGGAVDVHADVGPTEFEYSNGDSFMFFCLATGEQIIASVAPHLAPPPL